MRSIRVVGVLLSAILVDGGSVKAQSLTDGMVNAYNTNPRLMAERAALHATDESVPQALSGWRPTVNLNARFNHEYTDSVTDFTFSAGEQTINSKSIALELSQPLYRGGRTVNETQSAEEMVFAARARVTAVEQQVLLAAVTSHFDVVRAQEVTNLNVNKEQVLTKQLQATRDRFEVGELTSTDVFQAEARLADATASRVAAEGDLAVSRASYQAIVGALPTKLGFPSRESMPELFDSDTGRQLSMQRNPEIIAAARYERAALYDISVAAGVLLPEVTLDTSVSRAANPTTFTDEQDSFQIGLTGRLPLYQSGSEYAQIRELRMIAIQRRRELDTVRRQVEEEFLRTWEQLTTARARILSFEASVTANEVALDGVNQEAEVGSRTILDVLDAEQELFEAKANLVRAQRDEDVTTFKLLSVAGGMTAANLNLPVEIYDPGQHYYMVKEKWFGFDEDNEGGSFFDMDFGDLLNKSSFLDFLD